MLKAEISISLNCILVNIFTLYEVICITMYSLNLRLRFQERHQSFNRNKIPGASNTILITMLGTSKSTSLSIISKVLRNQLFKLGTASYLKYASSTLVGFSKKFTKKELSMKRSHCGSGIPTTSFCESGIASFRVINVLIKPVHGRLYQNHSVSNIYN